MNPCSECAAIKADRAAARDAGTLTLPKTVELGRRTAQHAADCAAAAEAVERAAARRFGVPGGWLR